MDGEESRLSIQKERSPEKLSSDDVDEIEQNETSDKVLVKDKQGEGQQQKVEIFSWFKERMEQWDQRHPGVYPKSRNNVVEKISTMYQKFFFFIN